MNREQFAALCANLLFLDVETASQNKNIIGDLDNHPVPSYAKETKELWEVKSRSIKGDLTVEESYEQKAALFPEFGMITAASFGRVQLDQNGNLEIRVSSVSGDVEKTVLEKVEAYLNNKRTLVGHNIKGFDIPYLSKRMLINGMQIPAKINSTGKKPWEVLHIDTMEMWDNGGAKSFVSLRTLCHLFDIESPKDEIDGSKTSKLFHEGGINRIVEYCEGDVKATIRVFAKLSGFFEKF